MVLVVPTLAFEGLWFLILVYCGTYGDFGPVIAFLVVTLPLVLPGIGALLDRRRRLRPGRGPAHVSVAAFTMVVIAALHVLVFWLMLLAAESSSGGEC